MIPLHIVEVVPSLAVGGAERVAALLAQGLQGQGHTVTVLSLAAPTGSWIEEKLRDAGLSTLFLGKRPGLDPRILPRLSQHLGRLRPDILHSHLHVLKYALPALAAAAWTRHRSRHSRCAVVHTLHNVAAQEAEALDRRLQRLAFRWGVQPVAIGAAVAESVPPIYGCAVRATIPNGIPVADYQAPQSARPQVRATLGLSPEAIVFLAVGRLNPQKNHALLLEAFSQVVAAVPQARLLIAGEGELHSALREQIARLGLGSRAMLLGVRQDVPRLLSAADVSVMSSTWEGNPLAVMEAMAAGRPVVSTAVGCVPELISPATGCLVPAGATDALAGALIALAHDPERRRLLGAAAQDAAQRRFDVAIMARAYADLFFDLRGKRG